MDELLIINPEELTDTNTIAISNGSTETTFTIETNPRPHITHTLPQGAYLPSTANSDDHDQNLNLRIYDVPTKIDLSNYFILNNSSSLTFVGHEDGTLDVDFMGKSVVTEMIVATDSTESVTFTLTLYDEHEWLEERMPKEFHYIDENEKTHASETDAILAPIRNTDVAIDFSTYLSYSDSSVPTIVSSTVMFPDSSTVTNDSGEVILSAKKLGEETILSATLVLESDTVSFTFTVFADKFPVAESDIFTISDPLVNEGSFVAVSDLLKFGGSSLLTHLGYPDERTDTYTFMGDDGTLTIAGDDLNDGKNIFPVVAYDGNGDEARTSIMITTDKSPTLLDGSPRVVINETQLAIDLTTVFGHHSGSLALTYSHTGTLPNGSMLNGTMLNVLVPGDGTQKFTLTATDDDTDKLGNDDDFIVHEILVVTDRSPTIFTTPSNVTGLVNGGTTIDISSVFANGSGVLTLDSSAGMVGTDKSLTIDGDDLDDGANSIMLTATDSNNDLVLSSFTVTTDKSPTIAASISDDNMRTINHSNTTIDLTTVFANGSGILTYAVTAPAGVSTANSALTIDYSTLGVGIHTVTVTATDSDADSISDVFVLEVHNHNSTLSDNSLGSNATLTGTTLAASRVQVVVADGGADNDTISNNTLTSESFLLDITFDGGDGDDTISDNHFESTSTATNHDVFDVTLMGRAGDDLFRDNTATQANGNLSSITIDGGSDADGNDIDEVHFDLASNLFTITGAYGSNIIVTDNAARTEAADGVDSYAEYVLIDIEELYFAGTDTAYVFGGG